jgi:hypothetical protein
MKKVVSTLTIITAIAISGCSKNDQAYYADNLDKAEEKIAECKADLREAIDNQDKDALRDVTTDMECEYAQRAVAEFNRKKHEEARRLAAEKFAQEYKEHSETLEKMTFKDFLQFGKQCQRYESFSQAQCKAYSDLKASKKQAEKRNLVEQYPNEKLEEYKERVCKGIDYDETYCELARSAVNGVKEDKIVFYQQNRDALVEDFNECQTIYQDLVDKKMKKEAKLAVDSYKCQLALAGARKVKVYNFSKPM